MAEHRVRCETYRCKRTKHSVIQYGGQLSSEDFGRLEISSRVSHTPSTRSPPPWPVTHSPSANEGSKTVGLLQATHVAFMSPFHAQTGRSGPTPIAQLPTISERTRSSGSSEDDRNPAAVSGQQMSRIDSFASVCCGPHSTARRPCPARCPEEQDNF